MSYICSRYYRAPELIFGATDYTCDIGKTEKHLLLLSKQPSDEPNIRDFEKHCIHAYNQTHVLITPVECAFNLLPLKIRRVCVGGGGDWVHVHRGEQF